MSEKNTVALNERDSSSLLSSCGVQMVASQARPGRLRGRLPSAGLPRGHEGPVR